jgi:hypothetical protein
MPGLFDAIQTVLGRPDPTAQLYAALGQGQSGGPGAAAGGGGAAAPGGAPGGAQAQPQAYQSPPDMAAANQKLAQGGQQPQVSPTDYPLLYLQMVQRQRASDDFNRGLAGMLGGFKGPPGGAQQIMNSVGAPSGQDPGATLQNILMLRNQQAMQSSVPAMLQKAGLDPSYAPLAMADPTFLPKIIETQMGVGGGTGTREYLQAKQAWQNDPANSGQPLPAYLQTQAGFEAQQAGNVATTKAKAIDLTADKANFQPALQAYDQKIGLMNQLMQPDMQEGMKESLGTAGSMRPVATMTDNGKKAWGLYKQVMAGQFAAGVQDFKGAGRITQQELNQDAPSQSTMGQLNQDPTSFLTGMEAYRNQLVNHRANLFGKAQYLDDPRLSDRDYDTAVSQNYKPGSDLGPAKVNRAGPDTSIKSPGDITKLPPGRAFVIPDGSGRIGYAP